MTEHEVFLALREVIKPIHEFWQTRQNMPYIPDSEIHFEVPPKYLKAFSGLYEELVRHTGTPDVTGKPSIASPKGLPAGTPEPLPPEPQPSPAPAPSPLGPPKA